MMGSLWILNIVIILYIAVDSGQYNGEMRSKNYPVTCANESSIRTYNRNLKNMNCMCDDKCSLYGDCCYDAPHNFTIISYNIFECIKFYGVDNIYVASKCPSEFNDSGIKEKCKKIVAEEELRKDLSLNMPVTDKVNNVTYANQYCAKCNNINTTNENFTQWIFKMSCDFPFVMKEDGTGYISIVEGSNTTIITFNGSLFDYCMEERAIPREIEPDTRICLQNVTKTCEGNSTSTCGGYMQYVHVNKEIFYNEICAKCSSISNTSIQYCPRNKIPCLDYDTSNNNNNAKDEVMKSSATIPYWKMSGTSNKVDNHCDRPISCSNISIFPHKRIKLPYGNCYCDEQCALYDDCCPDVAHNVTIEHPKIDFKCVNYKTKDHVYMIVSCHNDTWIGTDTERKCLFYDNDIYFSPVSDLITKFTYRNIFCAICNGVNTTSKELFYWEKKVSFEFGPKNYDEKSKYLKFNATSKRWSIEVKRRSYYFTTTLAKNLTDVVRACVPVVETCNDTYENNLISEKCEKEPFNTYVYKHPKDSQKQAFEWWPTAYRNIYCAVCNYQTENMISWCLQSGSKSHAGFDAVFQPISKNIWYKVIGNETEARSVEGISATWLSVREVLTYIGISVSIAFFLLHFALFFAVESLNSNFSGKCISSYSAALLTEYVLFCFWDFPSSAYCSLIAIASYYLFVVAFFWMFVMSFDVLRSTRDAVKLISPSQVNKKQRFIRYSIFCWVVPLFIVVFSLIIEYCTYDGIPKPMFGKGKICWISNESFQLYFFIYPCFALIITNVVLFVITSYWIYTNRKNSPTTSTKEHLSQYKLYGRLALIMGFTWLSALFAFITNYNIFWILYILLNTTQGPFIFFAFSCRRKVIKSFNTKYPLFHSISFTPSEKVTENTEL